MKTKILVASVVMALLTFGGAQAAATFTPGLSYSGGAQNLANPPYNLGYEFTTNSSVRVVALGIYQACGDCSGLIDSHDVSLWDSSGNLLASTTINPPSGTVQVAGFDYNTISQVVLAANSTYYIGAEYDTGSDPVLFPGYGGVFSTLSSINYVQSTYGNANAFPNNQFGTNGFFGPNLGIAVPEPATWAMMFVGFGGLGAAMRSQRRKAAVAAA
jgi:hypothetical protein